MVHRARHLLDTLRVGQERFRVFVFTNVLTSYIRSALDLLDLRAPRHRDHLFHAIVITRSTAS